MATYTYYSDIAKVRSQAEIKPADGRFAHANLNCARARIAGPISSGGVALVISLAPGAVVFPDLSYIKNAGSGAVLKAGGQALTSGAQLITSDTQDITITVGAAVASSATVEVGLVFGNLT